VLHRVVRWQMFNSTSLVLRTLVFPVNSDLSSIKEDISDHDIPGFPHIDVFQMPNAATHGCMTQTQTHGRLHA
jgi:hypothetical protein